MFKPMWDLARNTKATVTHVETSVEGNQIRLDTVIRPKNGPSFTAARRTALLPAMMMANTGPLPAPNLFKDMGNDPVNNVPGITPPPKSHAHPLFLHLYLLKMGRKSAKVPLKSQVAKTEPNKKKKATPGRSCKI